MNAFIGQLKKDFHLGRLAFLITLILLMAVYVLGLILEFWFDDTSLVLAGIAAITIFPHALYLLGYMIVSLHTEAKRFHLWLHQPLSGFVLLASKLINGLISMAISFVVACCVFLISSYSEITKTLDFTKIIELGLFVSVNLFLYAIYIAIWYTFYWSVYQYLKKKIGGFSWAVIIITGILITYLLGEIRTSAFFDLVVTWGSVPVPFFDTALNGEANLHKAPEPNLFLGIYLFHALLAFLLLWVSSWLIDKKIEV